MKVHQPTAARSIETSHYWPSRLVQAILATVAIPLWLMAQSALAGPVVIDGTDANDHGGASGGVNLDGWLYMQKVLENLASQVGNGNKIVVDLGTSSGSTARSAIDSAFNLSSLPGSGWTLVHFTSALQTSSFLGGGTVLGASLANTGIIYIPTSGNSGGDLSSISGALPAINAGAAAIADFVGGYGNPAAGGGLFAMAETGAGAFGWLTTVIPGISFTDVGGGGIATDMTLTAAGVTALPGLSAAALAAADPWHGYFSGNFGSLQVLATAPQGGISRNVILGGGGGTAISSTVLLTPVVATNYVGTTHTVTATITTNGQPAVAQTVSFSVISGPNSGTSGAGLTGSNGQASFTYTGSGGVGVDSILARFVDSTGKTNTSSAALKYWVTPPNFPPVAVCQDVTVAANGSCVATASIDGGSSDPDGDPITIVQTPPGPYPLGTNVVTLTVTDSKGASNSCTATVTVIDTTPPVIVCPPDIVVANDPGQCSAVVNFTVTAIDNCDRPSGVLYGSDVIGNIGPTGTSRLFTIDLSSGAGTQVGTLPSGSTEIEYNNASGRAFAQFKDGAFAGQEFDINTAAGIGAPVPNGASFTGLEWVGTNLYGTAITSGGGISPSTLRILDPDTGASTVVGLTGLGPVSGLAYDSTSGTMYGITGGPSNASLVTIDLGTGAATVIGNTGFRAGSLEFGPDGNLYAGSTGTSGGNLYQINPATGAATLVGPTGFPDIPGLALVSSTNVTDVTIVCNPPSGSAFPKGTTTVTCTATDAAGNTATCTFTVTVNDTEPPLVACREGANPSGKKIPVAGKQPKSGQNPDGFYQLLSADNCDPNPAIYIVDPVSGFLAGPFASGDIVKITQVPGGTPGQQPMAGVVVAHVFVNGDAVLYAVDADGNIGNGTSCLVPPAPK